MVMTEIMAGDEIYIKLRDFMDKLPGGFPSTESGVEMKILRKLFTREDAGMILCMTRHLEPPAVIAQRCGMSEAEASERLESMAARGLIGRVTEEGEVRYQAEQFAVGFYELQMKTIDREFAELAEEYFPHLGLSWASVKTEQLRIVPVASMVEVEPTVATYDRIRDLVKAHENMGLFECICSKQQELLGNNCHYPLEKCLVLMEMDFYLENGFPGRKIDVEEALRFLDHSEELGLVLRTDNAQEIRVVCSCCSCCCPQLRLIKRFPSPAKFMHSNYRSQIEPEKCDTCGVCADRCPMDAVVEGEEFMEISLDRCIGCGVCVSACPQEAISFIQREDAVVPPSDWEETLERIEAERRLA
jgi:Na+-translocating ferredoxin:NAD+ oxidoreductase subunit B